MTTVLFPTVVPLARETVADALVPWSAPVGRRVPSPMPNAFATVERFGGAPRTEVSEDATVTVECWHGDPDEAEAMAQAARQALHALRGTVAGEVTVYRVTTASSPRSLPHPSGKPRFTFSVSLHVRGATP